MKILQTNAIFQGKPNNYAKIDKYLSRSAQPKKEDFKWLKEQGVTDIINFRTMQKANIDFNEQEVVESLGMNYLNLPSISAKPNTQKVFSFLNLMNFIKKRNGKVHIHCMAGADRTGMYSYIYKGINKIGTKEENKQEWIQKGLNQEKYPNLIKWANNFLTFYDIHSFCNRYLH